MDGIGAYRSNTFVDEGTVTSANIALPFFSAELILTNDGGTDLTATIGGSVFTLKSNETLTLTEFSTKEVILRGSNIPYRLWAMY